MQYIFLVVAAAWALQFVLSYWQLRQFHRQIAELRKLGRCAVGMDGGRWQGRTYGVLVADEHGLVCHAALFSGWTVFSKLQPFTKLNGMRVDAILTSEAPPADLRRAQWRALQHAAQFFKAPPALSNQPSAA